MLSANPFGRGYQRRIGQIHRYYAVVGANGTTMVMMFVGGVVFVSTALSVLFLQWEICGAGVFRSLRKVLTFPNPNRVKLLNFIVHYLLTA